MNVPQKAALIMQDVNSLNINGFRKKDILMKKSPYSSNYSKAMHICCINMRQKEESRLPNLFTVSGYKIYFWSNENNEPIHVHISKGKPSPDSTKVWLTKKEDVFYPITEVRFQKKN